MLKKLMIGMLAVFVLAVPLTGCGEETGLNSDNIIGVEMEKEQSPPNDPAKTGDKCLDNGADFTFLEIRYVIEDSFSGTKYKDWSLAYGIEEGDSYGFVLYDDTDTKTSIQYVYMKHESSARSIGIATDVATGTDDFTTLAVLLITMVDPTVSKIDARGILSQSFGTAETWEDGTLSGTCRFNGFLYGVIEREGRKQLVIAKEQ